MTDPSPVAEHVTRDFVASAALDREEPASTRWASALRALTVRNARRFVYHHPADAGLVPDELTEAATMEIVAPTNDFVAMGEAIRTANRAPNDAWDRETGQNFSQFAEGASLTNEETDSPATDL